MKILYVINEYKSGDHIDVHRSLEKLKTEKVIEAYKTYPFLSKIKKNIKIEIILEEILQIISRYKPEAIIWSHTVNLKVNDAFLNRLRDKFPDTIHLYFDGDIYQRFYKPIPEEVVMLAGFCDVSFWPGYAPFIEKIRKNGGNDIRYVPLTSDDVRFANITNTYSPENGIVMIGNYISSKIPFKTFPGSKLRKKTADFLFQKYGKDFSLYGAGWGNSRYGSGQIPFEKQSEIYGSHKVSVGVNNLHANYYFSNRLPIALTSGNIMIHNYEPGIEEVFRDINYPFFFKNNSELLEIMMQILSYSTEITRKLTKEYREFALERLTIYVALKYILCVAREKFNNSKDITPNPWIKKYRI